MLDGAGGADPFDSGEVRDEVVGRALRALAEDAQRCKGTLKRSDVDRTYVKKHLTIVECERVELALGDAGISIVDDEPEQEAKLGTPEDGMPPRVARKYLTEQEERNLGRAVQLSARIQREGAGPSDFTDRAHKAADDARRLFVESNVRWVWKLARDMGPRQHLTIEDLFQEGMIGLLRGIELFDPDRGFRFKTYATWWIKQRMHRAIANDDRMVRLPVHVRDRIVRVRRAEKLLALELGRAPTESELAQRLGVETERLAQLLWRVHETGVLEADAPIGDDGEATIVSMIADETTPSAFDVVAHGQTRRQLREMLTDLLTPREENVLRLRFGLDTHDSHTLQTIGDMYDVTRERIRQIEAKALKKLKHPSNRRRLTFYFSEALGR